mmetsp:Transcript_14571/g.17243  ORF Transcript_14571/g.17243 Transcript_14571/m.17243 type:complete len:115 (-) Transcript_14571:33-377(-)|eukprot:CAMPEP_0198252696 /NCGR_PEP_ID=MMETSP1447-20131203/3178_1 /TAXON_ID=420782 /ORGANISM="Chaetoceros dichaeta, Strain CCMP1751" /LENGTH=114 /DNA_ID=CAMNT_0043938049 /DNA_START=135 /DNA_END=479 /DNA_ORIENTATION=-
MSKISRDLTTHLIKFVNRVDIRFNPFDDRTSSARELWRQMSGDRFKTANPKLLVKTNIVGTVDPPQVKVEFVDGTVKEFKSKEYMAREMMNEVFMFANDLDIEYELAGKSIDDK